MCPEDSGNILLIQVYISYSTIKIIKLIQESTAEKKHSDCMCADELRPSSSGPGPGPSSDPGHRPSPDPGLLAGVAVFVIVLVLSAACIVALYIWWR